MAMPMHSFSTAPGPALAAGSGWPLPGGARRPGALAPAGAWFWALDTEAGDAAPRGAEPVCLGLFGDPWEGLGAFAARRVLAELAARPAGAVAVIAAGADV